ncbi:MAG: hypothetical protein CBC62_05265, partial [Opitutia bacterium TMED102]
KAIKINPKYSGAYPAMGWMESWIKNRHDKALEHFDEALKYNPDNVTAMIWKSITCRAIKRQEEAIDLSLKSVELDPNNHVAHMVLSAAYSSNFQYDKAEQAARKSVGLKPDYGMGHRNLFGTLAMQENKRDEMIKHIQSLEALSTRDWNIESSIFLYYYYFGTEESFQKAADYIKNKANLTNYDLKGFPLYYFCIGEKELGYKILEEGVKNGLVYLTGEHRHLMNWDVIKNEERYKALYGDAY